MNNPSISQTIRVFAAALAFSLAASAALAADGMRPAKTLEETLALCRRTYDYVARSVPKEKLSGFAAELDDFDRCAQSASTNEAKDELKQRVCALRRRILFTHPDLQFEKLLCVQREIPYSKYNHEVDQYLGRFSNGGPGLVVLTNWRDRPQKQVLLEGKMPKGCVLNPDLHWDADRILFAFCDHTRQPEADARALKAVKTLDDNIPEYEFMHRRYFIYECAADGSWVRQLTGCVGDKMETCEGRQTTIIEDADPCYLPDGGFLFNSTRCQNFGRCHWGRYTPSFLLYRGELPPVGAIGAARDIRQWSFGEANEWEPSVMADGRVLYTRWDYINRDSTWLQSLWTAHPDGTAVAHFYGSYSRNLTTPSEAKNIPGTPFVVATAGAHHMRTGGSLVILDPRQGEDGAAPISRLTPETPFPEREGWNFPGYWAAPMPVNDTLFFCSYTDCRLVNSKTGKISYTQWPSPHSTSIWLVDSMGGRELIYQDPEHSTFNPIPMVRRKRPATLTSTLPPRETAPDTGVCYVENCYESRHGIPKGSIAALRVNRLFNQPTPRRFTQFPEVGHFGDHDQEVYKESLGTVPVAPDGSAAFRIPAGMPIQLQAIDQDGVAVLTMRSFIYSQKGEVQGCIGCHEDKRVSRGSARVPSGLEIHDPVPEVDLGYHGPFSYARSIQPIFDRKCISCHGLGKAPSFIGFKGLDHLRRRGQVVSVPIRDARSDIARVREFYAAGSPLLARLRKGHGPKLTRDELRTIILWMDLDVPPLNWGGYSWNLPEFRSIDPVGQGKLRQGLASILGLNPWNVEIDAFVNRGDVTKSRALMLCRPQDRERVLELCRGVLRPHPAEDIQGTCGRDDNCECFSCWVRRGGYNRPPAK